MEEISSTTSASRLGQQSLEASASTSYFSHHGLMAPGVRSFRNLRFQTKALLISTAFLVPLMLLVGFYMDAALQSRHFTQREQVGVAQIRDVVSMIKLGQSRRKALVDATAQGRTPDDLAAIQQKMDALWHQIEEAEAVHQTQQLAEAIKHIQEANGKAAKYGEGIFKIYATHSKYVTALTDYSALLADVTGLRLDSDLDSYYLADAGVMNMPELINTVARMQGLAAAAALSGQGGALAGVELARLDALAENLIGQLQRSVSKVVEVHPEYGPTLHLQELIKQVNELRELCLEEPGVDGAYKAEQVSAKGVATVNAMWALQGTLLDKLDDLLSQRLDHVSKRIMGTLAAVGLSLCVAAYMFLAFYLVMTGGLREIKRYLDAAAAGDLSAQPKAWGKDEAADLLLALCDMQSSLSKVIEEVRGQSDKIIEASFVVAGGATELSTHTGETAASLQQAVDSMNVIAGTVRRSVDEAQEAATLVSENVRVAERGGSVMHQVASTMSDINASSNRISEIIGVIDGIAFQTNILALNAAVEAARAGEHGRGFAVVASEVRALAQRSSGAAREIKNLISASVDKVESGNEVVREANAAIQELVTNASRINQLFDSIASGGQQQASGINQIADTITSLNSVTQQNAQMAGNTSSQADQLTECSSELMQRVALFKTVGI